MEKKFILFWKGNAVLVDSSKYGNSAQNVLDELKNRAVENPAAQTGIVFLIDTYEYECNVMYMNEDFNVYKFPLNGASFVRISWIIGDMSKTLEKVYNNTAGGLENILYEIPESEFKDYLIADLKEKGVIINGENDMPNTNWHVIVIDSENEIYEQTISAVDYGMESPVDHALRMNGGENKAAFGFDEATESELAFATGATTYVAGPSMSKIAAKLNDRDAKVFSRFVDFVKENIGALGVSTSKFDYVKAKKICNLKDNQKLEEFLEKGDFIHEEYAKAVVEVLKTYQFEQVRKYVRGNVFVTKKSRKRYIVLPEEDAKKIKTFQNYLAIVPQASNGCYVLEEKEIEDQFGKYFVPCLTFTDPDRVKVLVRLFHLNQKQTYNINEIPSKLNNKYQLIFNDEYEMYEVYTAEEFEKKFQNKKIPVVCYDKWQDWFVLDVKKWRDWQKN